MEDWGTSALTAYVEIGLKCESVSIRLRPKQPQMARKQRNLLKTWSQNLTKSLTQHPRNTILTFDVADGFGSVAQF
eukprot:6412584-Amphidinium_carterae.1